MYVCMYVCMYNVRFIEFVTFRFEYYVRHKPHMPQLWFE